jgi:ribose/xylose/arabinose/galactoside ABC-type transport system permease subunit
VLVKSVGQIRNLSLFATLFVLALLYTAASVMFREQGFASMQVFSNLLADNAFLGIAAVGMTFVILSGGIDLSVGSVMAFTTIFLARAIGSGMHPLLAILIALGIGGVFGSAMGYLIDRFELPPFLVTLGGMFFARGMAFVVSKESIGIEHPIYSSVQGFGIPLGSAAALPTTALIFLMIFLVGVYLAHHTRFGRTIYAIGGNEASARLMGLPVGSTKVIVYALNGLLSALAGVVSSFYTGSGDPTRGAGFELDVIASVVIGGTLLTGGVGTMAGTLAGVLIFGTIKTALDFHGELNSWWLRIVVGVLLLLFILFQRFLSRTSPQLKSS